jgi:hypothetical protein
VSRPARDARHGWHRPSCSLCRFVGCREDVGLAGIDLSLDALDDPIVEIGEERAKGLIRNRAPLPGSSTSVTAPSAQASSSHSGKALKELPGAFGRN